MTDNVQIDDGRIIVDSKMWSTYNPDQTPNLEGIDNPSSGLQPNGDELSPWSSAGFIMYDHDDPSTRLAMQAIGHHARRHMDRRPRPQDTQANSILTSTLNYNRR